ncbi:MAG: DUF4233 domain-containing protein [Candidatus Nanopelagicales bacterium]
MKVLCSAVLSLEAIVVLLAIPIATTNGSVANTALAVWLGFGIALLLLLTVGTLRRPWGITLGWILQVVVLAIGFYVPAMFIVGGIFAVLWFVAIQQGLRIDALKAQRVAAAPPVG